MNRAANLHATRWKRNHPWHMCILAVSADDAQLWRVMYRRNSFWLRRIVLYPRTGPTGRESPPSHAERK